MASNESNYRAVRRPAEGQGTYLWYLININTGRLLRKSYDNKGLAQRAGLALTERAHS